VTAATAGPCWAYHTAIAWTVSAVVWRCVTVAAAASRWAVSARYWSIWPDAGATPSLGGSCGSTGVSDWVAEGVGDAIVVGGFVVGGVLLGVGSGVLVLGDGVGVGVSDGEGVSLGVAVTSEGVGETSARATPVSIVSVSAAVAATSSGRRRRTCMTVILSVSASGGEFGSVVSVTSC